MDVEKVFQPILLSIDYRKDAINMLAATHDHIADQGLVPSIQHDTYSVPSKHIVGAIGRTGLRLSTKQERCPITDSLIPMQATVDVYNDLFRAATTYEYDYSKYSDIWTHRLSALDAHKAQPLTTTNVAGLLAARMEDARELNETIDSPFPTSTNLVNNLLKYADKHSSDHTSVSKYTIPFATKSTRGDHKNDANAIFTTESHNGRVSTLSLDVATYHELEDDEMLLRVITVADKINPRNTSNEVKSSLSLYGKTADNYSMQKLLSSEIRDTWQLYRYIKAGAATLKSVTRLKSE